MRYIILNKEVSNSEIESRKKYIEKATSLFFIKKRIEEGIEFCSIPSTSINCVLIVGHNKIVKEYLENNRIIEENIVVVSCFFQISKRLFNEKNVYVSYGNDGKTSYYDGTQWNLNFNISKEELKLINSYGDFINRINKYFRRILWWKNY